MISRSAVAGDLDAVTDTLTLAFSDDPVWSVALARPDGCTDHHRPYWRIFVDAAHALGGIRLVGDADAVSVWIPPGGAELAPDLEDRLTALNRDQLGDQGAREISELYDRFEAAHPRAEHAYLSLLGTHPRSSGRGVGQSLLVEDLARWDARSMPCYLESSNPANDHRYQRLGFVPIGGFEAVRDTAHITTMWRTPALA